MGTPIKIDINTDLVRSLVSLTVRFVIVEPNILRIPISLLLRSKVNAASPNSPRHVYLTIIIVITTQIINSTRNTLAI